MELYKYFLEGQFVPTFFGGIYPGYLGLHVAVSVLYSLIAFVPDYKANKIAPAEEDVACAEDEAVTEEV
jgi:hypothetical protein